MPDVEPFHKAFPDGPAVRGFLHRPAVADRNAASRDALILTHGAGSNSQSPLLVALASAFVEAGFVVLRCDLAFRQARSKGPPLGTAESDRLGLRRAVESIRELTSQEPVAQTAARKGVFLGGHSYGGRQASMLAADEPGLVDGLLLLSYPLHPPRKPDQLRTAHLHNLQTPALFVHGSRDPFGSFEEMQEALRLIPATTKLLLIEGAGHELEPRAAPQVVSAFQQLFSPPHEPPA